MYTHAQTHTYTYEGHSINKLSFWEVIYIYRERERDRDRDRKTERIFLWIWFTAILILILQNYVF